MGRPDDGQLPLMERKRLSTRRRIQAAALDLIGSGSYEAVTVEQIADRSEVSPSTVYRYFGSKEQIILWDEYDEAFLEAFRDRLTDHSPGEAMLGAMAGLFGESGHDGDVSTLEHLRLVASVPELQAAQAARVDELMRTMAVAIVDSGLPEADASIFSGAVVGAFVGALDAWVSADGTAPLAALLERTASVVAGLDEMFADSPGD